MRRQFHRRWTVLRRISIHAPQWGATRRTMYPLRYRPNFNPRTPVGCDRTSPRTWPPWDNFNPRTPVGCDHLAVAELGTGRDFNPRTPVGCDNNLTSVVHVDADFNPRTPVGCDIIKQRTQTDDGQFQSTHPSGVRRRADTISPAESVISIHAPQWGAVFVQ